MASKKLKNKKTLFKAKTSGKPKGFDKSKDSDKSKKKSAVSSVTKTLLSVFLKEKKSSSAKKKNHLIKNQKASLETSKGISKSAQHKEEFKDQKVKAKGEKLQQELKKKDTSKDSNIKDAHILNEQSKKSIKDKTYKEFNEENFTSKQELPSSQKVQNKELQENIPNEEILDEDQTLRDALGRPYCKVKDCDQIAQVEGYCRYHYLLLWKKIQIRRKILADGKLERYVEELTARYPDKYLEVIRKDLLTEKNFLAIIAEMEIDESTSEADFQDEDPQSLEEVRHFSESNILSDDEF